MEADNSKDQDREGTSESNNTQSTINPVDTTATNSLAENNDTANSNHQNGSEYDPYLGQMERQLQETNLRASQKAIDRIKFIIDFLRGPKVNIPGLQAVCFHGIPDELCSLRPLCWKILLGYLPDNRANWESTLEKNRKNYEEFKKEYYEPLMAAIEVHQAKKKALKAKKLAMQSGEEHKEGENTVNNSDNNVNLDNIDEKLLYKGFEVDEELWEDVVKDTTRTRSGMDFYQRLTQEARERQEAHNKEKAENLENGDKGENDTLKNNKEEKYETHNDVLARILFIYAKLNPGVRYVQGMNEVVAPIYYSFSADTGEQFKDHAEADTFCCFVLIMGEVQDAFIKHLDHTEVGIQARMKTLNDLLKRVDIQMWNHLEKYGVNPQFYTLRWLMLLLTQEFEICEVIRLWDSLLSHPNKLTYLNYICLAMVLRLKDKLMELDDFADLIEVLQKETAEDIDEILALGSRLYGIHTDPEERVYHIAF